MDFSEALKAIKMGKKVYRQSWASGAGVFLSVAVAHQTNEENSLHCTTTYCRLNKLEPFLLYMQDEKYTPYTLTNDDLLADNWWTI